MYINRERERNTYDSSGKKKRNKRAPYGLVCLLVVGDGCVYVCVRDRQLTLTGIKLKKYISINMIADKKVTHCCHFFSFIVMTNIEFEQKK